MAKTPYQLGQVIQYRAKKELEKEGYHTMIGAKSLGPFDIIAWHQDPGLFIQVKSCGTKKFYFEKGELEKIIGEKIPQKCFKEIWIWIKNIKNIENRGWRRWRHVSRGTRWELITSQPKGILPGLFEKPF